MEKFGLRGLPKLGSPPEPWAGSLLLEIKNGASSSHTSLKKSCSDFYVLLTCWQNLKICMDGLANALWV